MIEDLLNLIFHFFRDELLSELSEKVKKLLLETKEKIVFKTSDIVIGVDDIKKREITINEKKYTIKEIYDDDYDLITAEKAKEIFKILVLFIKIQLDTTGEEPTIEDKENLIKLNEYFEKKDSYSAQRFKRNSLKISIKSIEEKLASAEIRTEFERKYNTVKDLNEKLQKTLKLLGLKPSIRDNFKGDIDILDPDKYYYNIEGDFNHYIILLEILEKTISDRINTLLNPDAPIDSHNDESLYYDKSLNELSMQSYDYRNKNLLCEDQPDVFLNMLDKELIKGRYEEYNTLASVFCIKISNFISSAMTEELDMSILINNLKTSSVGQISFLLHYLMRKSSKFNQKYFEKSDKVEDNDILYSYIFEERRKDKVPLKIFEELSNPDSNDSSQKKIAKTVFDEKFKVDEDKVDEDKVDEDKVKFCELCYEITKNYIYRYIFNKLIKSSQSIITRSNIQTYYFKMLSNVEYINDLSKIEKSKIVQLLKIFNILKVDTNDYLKNYFPSLMSGVISQTISKIVFSIMEIKDINITQSFDFYKETLYSIDFGFNFKKQYRPDINNVFERIYKIIIIYQKNWDNYFETQETPIINITSLVLNIDYFIEFEKILEVFPNLKELDYKFIYREEGFDINIAEDTQINDLSLDLFQVSKIKKIVVKKPDSKIKLKYLRDNYLEKL